MLFVKGQVYYYSVFGTMYAYKYIGNDGDDELVFSRRPKNPSVVCTDAVIMTQKEADSRFSLSSPNKQRWVRAYQQKGSAGVAVYEGYHKSDVEFDPSGGKWVTEPILLWEEK